MLGGLYPSLEGRGQVAASSGVDGPKRNEEVLACIEEEDYKQITYPSPCPFACFEPRVMLWEWWTAR